MKIRVKFAKQGITRFIGHLDVMRYFQKLNRRAKLDIAYSGGFSPHQEMSFATPLGLGVLSKAEYVDMEVNSLPEREALIERMNDVSIPDLQILDIVLLPEDAKNAMSLLSAADYQVHFREGKMPFSLEELEKRFQSFLDAEEILALKETKKSSKIANIRPQIREGKVLEDGIFLKLDTGSASNLKPELVLKSFYEKEGFPFDANDLLIERLELYGEEENALVPLSEYGIRWEGALKQENC